MASQGTGIPSQLPTNEAKVPGEFGPIEVFRAGSFTDMSGQTQTISRQNLADIAAIYDPEEKPAPVVIGHPETDAPAYGWVSRLYLEGDTLKAMLRDVVPEFSEAVKAGRYKKVSISLFLPSSTANPEPGKFYLRHVGFLGAQAPAVPGLKPVKFSGDLGASFAISQAFAAPLSPEMRELAALRRDAVERRVEDLISQGRVLPVFKDEVLSFAAHLGSSDTVSFADGSEKPARDWFFDYLSKQPVVVQFGEYDMPKLPWQPGAAPQGAAGVQIPDGFKVDERQSELAARAHEISLEKGVSFADALDLIEGGVN